jgi:hypothetical protein
MQVQLDFFPETLNEFDEIREEINTISNSCSKVRKAMFARHGELSKLYLDLSQRLEIIERHICR